MVPVYYIPSSSGSHSQSVRLLFSHTRVCSGVDSRERASPLLEPHTQHTACFCGGWNSPFFSVPSPRRVFPGRQRSPSELSEGKKIPEINVVSPNQFRILTRYFPPPFPPSSVRIVYCVLGLAVDGNAQLDVI
jgi:hypothetical protein